jgi:hypothetical protein
VGVLLNRSLGGVRAIGSRFPGDGALSGGEDMTTVGELMRLMVQSCRWRMVPMLAVLGLTALLLVGVAAVEYVAPFVYTIF